VNSKEFVARRIAKIIDSNTMVNLGAGLPALVSNYLPENVDVFFQAENGIVGCTGIGAGGAAQYEIDAGGAPCAIRVGGAMVDSLTSFGLIRGGHLDVTVLGAMQVDAEGSLANWIVPGGKFTGMGGAMDLVAGARKVIVATEHCSKDGSPKILGKCTFPLTGHRVVSLIVTELAVIQVTDKGLLMTEIAPGIAIEEVRQKTGAPLLISDSLCEMVV